jgi:signal peptidase II
MSRAFRLWIVIFAVLVALDQAVKAWARLAAEGVEGRSLWPLWPGVFELKLVYNHGIAFGLLQGMGVFMAPIALVMAGLAGWHTWKHPKDPLLVHVTTGALAAGAIGNLIDRLWMGKVTDMFWIRIIDFPVFNIADMCITFAGVMLILASLKDILAPRPPEEAEGQVEKQDKGPEDGSA